MRLLKYSRRLQKRYRTGSRDEEFSELLKGQFDISKSKARAMLREMRKDGETTIPVTRQVL